MHTDEMGIVSCLSAEILFRNCVRDDKLATTWRRQFKHRCLIPAELFYEWEVLAPEEKKKKMSKPRAVSLMDDWLFSFGGVWDS
jgi:putative SOS response-associated peptidase YedK